MRYPFSRNRRLRKNKAIRSMVSETIVSPNDLIAPVFVVEGENIKEEIDSMPGYFRYSLDMLSSELEDISKLDIPSVLLFVKVPDEKKDNKGTEANNPDGLMQKAIKKIKSDFPDLYVMSDVALDPYSNYGHDGIVEDGVIVNDPTLEVLSKMALSHAEAGVDMVAPSDMMDGRVLRIRQKLDEHNFTETGIMSYAAKYASGFYGPFRDALDSDPGFGDKKTYQMDYSNSQEAVKEALMDQDEGADILMVKPALPYLDVIKEVKKHTHLPVAAYNVSGEYSMVKASSEKGWIDEDTAILEITTGIKRAGADLIATYFAKDLCKLLKH